MSVEYPVQPDVLTNQFNLATVQTTLLFQCRLLSRLYCWSSPGYCSHYTAVLGQVAVQTTLLSIQSTPDCLLNYRYRLLVLPTLLNLFGIASNYAFLVVVSNTHLILGKILRTFLQSRLSLKSDYLVPGNSGSICCWK